jgi:outer membrane protein OmpU
MNNFKKVGLSALAGSLAMVSANAVEYTMSGGLMAVYSSQDAATSGYSDVANSGRGIGVASDLSFNASGELDNGFTIGYFMGVDTNGALSNTSSQMTVGMGDLGSLHINNKYGSKANAIDDITPNAYNETWDGLTTGSGLTVATTNNPSWFGSSTSSGSIDYRMPAQEQAGFTLNAAITYDPNAGVGPASKGGVTATNGGSGSAYVVQVAHESGLEIGAGYEDVDTSQGAGTNATDLDRTTVYVKFASGGLSVAYQEAMQNSSSDTDTPGADQEAMFLGIAYTMGDTTISYGESELDVKAVSDTAARATIELESIQAAYVMGAMTLSAAMSETNNVGGVASNKYEENTLAVSFAF